MEARKNGNQATRCGIPEKDRVEANMFIMRYLQGTMLDGRAELCGLRRKLAVTYWVIIGLSIVMFAVGMVLISVPTLAAFYGGTDLLAALAAAGFGVADLTALFFFRPLERIHRMMGDMSQITLALNSFQIQIGLRLREMNAHQRETIGRAAGHVGQAAGQSIEMVQRYFELAQPKG